MPITVEIPDVGEVEFPDSMSEADILNAIETEILGGTKASEDPLASTPSLSTALSPPGQNEATAAIPRDPYVATSLAEQLNERAASPAEQAIEATPAMQVAGGLREGAEGIAKEFVQPKNLAINAGLAALAIAAPTVGLPIIAGLGAKGLGETVGTASVAAQQGDIKGIAREIPGAALSAAMTLPVGARAVSVVRAAEATAAPLATEALKGASNLNIVPDPVAKIAEIQRGNALIDNQRIKTAVAEKDVMPGRDTFASPEFEFRNLPEAVELATKINEAELSYKSATAHDLQRMDALKSTLNLAEQLQVTRAMKAVESKADIDAISKLPEPLQKTAREVRAYFDEIKGRVKEEKEAVIFNELSGPQQNALRQVESGVSLTEAAKQNGLRESGKATVESALNEIREIRDWGIEDYITHIERGNHRVVTPEGSTVAVAETRQAAAIKADIWLKENPDVKTVTLSTEFAPGIEFPAQLSQGQMFRLVQRMQEKLNEKLPDDAIAIQDILRAQGSIVTVKPTNKYAAPMQQRRNVLKGEENVFNILPLYSAVMRKKLALDPVLREARNVVLPKLPKNAALQLENLLKDVKGRKTIGDEISDYVLAPLGTKPFAYSRAVEAIGQLTTNLKLGYRPVAAIVNRTSGLMHTWVKVGTPYLMEGRRFLKTPEGKALLDQNKPFLGIEAAFIDEGRRAPANQPIYGPLGMFEKAEQINRPEAFASFYVYGVKKLNMLPQEAVQFARNSTRLAQFTYNLASLSRMMRGPTGRLLFKFKPYLIKEMEFISTLRGAEIGRYMTGFLLLGGPRAALYTLKSLPLLGALGILSELEDWLNQEMPVASRGVGGALGVDVSPSVAFQFPQTPEELFGPFFSDITKLWKNVIGPALRGEDRDWRDVQKWGQQLAPAMNYWSQLVEAAMHEGGWITDNRGRPEYQPTKADMVKLALGAKPLEKSIAEVEKRFLKDTEEIDRRNRMRLIDDYLNAVADDDGEKLNELTPRLAEMGVTAAMLRNAARGRQMEPKLRLFQSLRKKRRADEAGRFDGEVPSESNFPTRFATEYMNSLPVLQGVK